MFGRKELERRILDLEAAHNELFDFLADELGFEARETWCLGLPSKTWPRRIAKTEPVVVRRAKGKK